MKHGRMTIGGAVAAVIGSYVVCIRPSINCGTNGRP
jgi:hypothetical protein